MKNVLKKGSKIKVISGFNKGIIDFVIGIDHKKKIIYLEKIKRKITDCSKHSKKSKNFNNLKLFVPINFSNVVVLDEEEEATSSISSSL